MNDLKRENFEEMADAIRTGRMAPFAVQALLDMNPAFATWCAEQVEPVVLPASAPTPIGGAE